LTGGPLGHPTCRVAYGLWFDRLDPLKSGTFNHDAFIADAETQFKTMDLDHDGYITAAELTKYRAGFDFDPSLGFALERKSSDDDSSNRFAKKRDPNAPDWAVSSWTPDSADPVMSADRSLKFRVSHEDYMVQAEDIFRKLDTKHDGQIPKERILAVCPKDPLDEEHHSWF
jgi:Ca2+-binding EF-hand superfamily protein